MRADQEQALEISATLMRKTFTIDRVINKKAPVLVVGVKALATVLGSERLPVQQKCSSNHF